jgi:hypothetical protein
LQTEKQKKKKCSKQLTKYPFTAGETKFETYLNNNDDLATQHLFHELNQIKINEQSFRCCIERTEASECTYISLAYPDALTISTRYVKRIHI